MLLLWARSDLHLSKYHKIGYTLPDTPLNPSLTPREVSIPHLARRYGPHIETQLVETQPSLPPPRALKKGYHHVNKVREINYCPTSFPLLFFFRTSW